MAPCEAVSIVYLHFQRFEAFERLQEATACSTAANLNSTTLAGRGAGAGAESDPAFLAKASEKSVAHQLQSLQ